MADKYTMPGFGSKTGTTLYKKEDGEHTTSGLPENLYDPDGNAVNTTTDVDEGNLSGSKTESGTGRKYVEYVEGSKAGGKLYFNNPK